jgi:GT2 family glycosyltransferase
MDLSVVIVNYNVRYFLEQCLKSVRKASENISCETFVVDNNSADGSCSMVSISFPEVHLIRNSENEGFSAACNQAIRQSKGDYILLLNPDTVVEEDTFARCLSFMKSHPDAGAIGVKMLNGNGRLHPESKRALPTPSSAFFKISGLSGLFPRSGIFNRYYLGHLNSSETTEADVLSGAFMFIRREALDKTGLLDETFFMYGEDIDLSYRIIKAGFKNYYFPDVKIIHYKGESTPKGELNNTIHFYRAMLIFIGKHYKKSGYRPVLFFMGVAIYILATISVLKNLLIKYFLPLTDSVVIYLIFSIIIPVWGRFRFGDSYSYPGIFSHLIIPVFILTVILSVFFNGGYRLPSRTGRVIKGLITGSVIAMVLYALLPVHYRFSRMVVVLGSVSIVIIIPLLRLLLAIAGVKSVINPFARAGKTVIVSDKDGYMKLSELIKSSREKQVIAGRVGISQDDLGKEVLGNIRQIRDIIKINQITEVVFSTRRLTASQLIESMQLVADCNIDIRIAPPGEKILLGSKRVSPGDDFAAI